MGSMRALGCRVDDSGIHAFGAPAAHRDTAAARPPVLVAAPASPSFVPFAPPSALLAVLVVGLLGCAPDPAFAALAPASALVLGMPGLCSSERKLHASSDPQTTNVAKVRHVIVCSLGMATPNAGQSQTHQ
jgi:hypothetical protein